MSEQAFWREQERRFVRIYGFARREIPYYRNNIDSYPPLPPGPQPLLDRLSVIPILSKSVVKAHNAAFWPHPLPRLTAFHATSGTTGTPLRVPSTIWDRAYAQTNYEAWLQRICGHTHPPTLYLTGFLSPSASRELVWRDLLTGDAFLSIYALNAANRQAIAAVVRDVNPRVIYGYASSVFGLAQLFDEERLPGHDRRIAVTTSEVLYPGWRQSIEHTICSRVFQYYGAQEHQHLVVECEAGMMHIHPLIGIVEILREDGGRAGAGQQGRVVVTGLHRHSMPLIRYDLGDVATSTGYATHCPCGLQWPTIGQFEGRVDDLVVTRDGRRIGMLAFHTTRYVHGIREAQLIQRGFEHFVFRVVLADAEPAQRGEMEATMRRELLNRVGGDLLIEFDYVKHIPRGPNGKFRAAVVELDPPDRAGIAV
jgi:phenylacetate-CoA ligase